jgi:ABC-2 type transport system ATP-binding protein
MSAPRDAIVAEGLAAGRGAAAAFAGLELRVPTGAVCALVGPAGAGKTTALCVLATLLAPRAGGARVAGHDVVRDPAAVRRRIGLVARGATGCDALTGRQNLERLACLYGLAPAIAGRRAAELLELLGLAALADRPAAAYHPAARRRLDLAASAVGGPDVLLVDEPAADLDPAGAAGVWEALRRLGARGATVLLATRDGAAAATHAGHVVSLRRGHV